MTLQAVEQARAAYRERHITQHYSSPLRLAPTVSVSLLIASLSAMVLKDVSPLEWLTIPLTFLYANLTEYLGHKGPMHHKTRFFSPIFEHHSIQHHAFFADKSLTYDTTQDGIDKLSCRRGLALPDRGINALYVNASAHSERVLRSKDT